jgi:OOP family OmpA-OmpF porin
MAGGENPAIVPAPLEEMGKRPMGRSITRALFCLFAALFALLPALAHAAGEERALDDAAAPAAKNIRIPFDTSILVNADPSAMPVGIRFMSSVPLETRRLLLEDLTWLNGVGPLPDSELLADLLGVAERPLTGAHLAAWTVEAVHTLVGPDFCTPGARLLASGSPTQLDFVDDDREFCLEEPNDWAWSAIQDAVGRRARQVDLIYIDGELLVPRRIGIYLAGLVALNESALASSYAEIAELPREVRLALLIHEAFHAVNDAYHIACDKRWMFGPQELVIGPLEWEESERDCDPPGYFGSYSVEAEVVRVFLELCAECSRKLREALTYHQVESWSAVGIWARGEIEIPASARLEESTGVAGQSFMIFPPRQFFVAMAEDTRLSLELCEDKECTQRWRTYVAESEEVLRVLDAAAEAGELPPLWSAPSIPEPLPSLDLDLAATTAWIEAALAAEDNGYNVPLRFLVPCDQLAASCAMIAEGMHGPSEVFDPSWTGNEVADALFKTGAYTLSGFSLEARRGKLSDEAVEVLAEVRSALLANPYWRVVVEAHTDDEGEEETNLQASERSAVAIRRYLTDTGISANRIEAVGYGETRPVASNDTEEGREANRRIEIRLVPL